ncbi:MAG: hypothetical protein TREMPRED_004433, partial [Tremellales sp. Tagirdzhanova-0007]
MTYTNVIGTFVCLASNQMEYLVFSPVTASIPVRIAPQPVAPPVAASSLDLRPEVASRALESFARAFADICGSSYESHVSFVEEFFDENARFRLSLTSSAGIKLFDIPAISMTSLFRTLNEAGVSAQELDVRYPSETVIWPQPPSPDGEAMILLNSPSRDAIRINFLLATWTLYFPFSEVIMTATVEATWVPVTGNPSLKMETLVINVNHHESQGNSNIGEYGVPDTVIADAMEAIHGVMDVALIDGLEPG